MIADYVASARHRSTLQVWLRDTMYKRLVKPGQKPGFAPTVMTFVTSAFWHGIGTGYYREFLKVCVSAGFARIMLTTATVLRSGVHYCWRMHLARSSDASPRPPLLPPREHRLALDRPETNLRRPVLADRDEPDQLRGGGLPAAVVARLSTRLDSHGMGRTCGHRDRLDRLEVWRGGMVEAGQCAGRADGCEKDQVEPQSKRSGI